MRHQTVESKKHEYSLSIKVMFVQGCTAALACIKHGWLHILYALCVCQVGNKITASEYEFY